MRLKLTSKLIRATPKPLRLLLKRLGFQKIFNRIMSKSEGELIFQTAWVGKFKENRAKVLEHWRKYRCLDEIKGTCKFTPDKKVLDVGCGVSTILHFIAGERYGIDPLADEYLKMYEYPPGISVQKGVGENIPFPDDFFDVVFCSNVLDHTDNPRKVVEEIARVLKSKGYFISTVYIFGKTFKRDPAHPYTFTREDVLSLIRDNFRIFFEEEFPLVDIYNGEASRKADAKELILVLRKP